MEETLLFVAEVLRGGEPTHLFNIYMLDTQKQWPDMGDQRYFTFGLIYRLCPTRERMHKALVLECSERAGGQMGKHSNDGRCA